MFIDYFVVWGAATCLAMLVPVVVMVSFLMQTAWAWMDDNKKSDRNTVATFITDKIMRKNSENAYSRGASVVEFMAYVFFAPAILALSIDFYTVSISILTFVAIAHLVRFTRRLDKKLKMHTDNDPKETEG